MDARFLVVVEKHLLHAIARFQLDLLRGGVGNMPIVGLHLFDEVGSRRQVRHDDFAHLIGLVDADVFTVTPNLEGDIRHGLKRLSVILDDLQTGFLGIDKRDLGCFAGNDGCGFGRLHIHDVSGNACGFFHLVAARLELRELDHAARSGLTGLRFTGFQILDLDGDALQILAGVADLVNAKAPIGRIVEGQDAACQRGHSDVLRGDFRQKVGCSFRTR